MSFTPSQIRYPEYFTKHLDDTYVANTFVQMDGIDYGDVIIWILQVTNNDSISHKVRFNGSGDDNSHFIEVDVPAGTGFAGVAPLQVLPLWMPSQYQYLVLGKENGPSLWFAAAETLNSGKLVVVSALAGYV